MNLFTSILFILISTSAIFCRDDSDYIKKQKQLFDDHQTHVTGIKKEYVNNKNFIDSELNRLMPLYNSLKRDYDSLVDSLDNIVKNRVKKYSDGIDDPEVEGHMYLMEKAKQSVLKKMDERNSYYQGKFDELDSRTDFYFDVLLAYESNSLDVNDIVLKLQAENIAYEKMIRQANEELDQLENGISKDYLNESIISLISADRLINNQNYEEAIEECNKSIKLFPHLSIAYEKLGSAYYLNNDYESALKYWNTALALNPENSNLSQFLSALK